MSGKDEIGHDRVEFHTVVVGGQKFTLPSRYTPLKLLGEGAYGKVCSAVDNIDPKRRKVALKKIPDTFADLVDAKRILREIRLLQHFKHPNVVRLRDLVASSKGTLDELYMVLDYMETDLHYIIYSKNRLTDEHYRYFTYQILRGLKHIHSARVIHRDLKPSNLLVNSNCDLKVCDFGLARGIRGNEDYLLTEYVVTRWYRAPEVMVSCQEYDYKIDVWAVGCILAELILRQPLFPGNDYIQQMNLIFNVLGTPKPGDMDFVTNKNALTFIKKQKVIPKVNFKEYYPDAHPEAIDLLERMLQFHPEKRISVDEALEHPYLAHLRRPSHARKDMCPAPFDFGFEAENDCSKLEVLQELMWQDVRKYRPNAYRAASQGGSTGRAPAPQPQKKKK